MIYELKNKELGIVRLLSISLDVYLKNIRFILAIIVTINLPIAILNKIVSFLSNDLKETANWEILIFVYILDFLLIIPRSLPEMAVVLMVERYLIGEKTNFFTTLKRVFSYLLKFNCLKLKVSLGVFLGFLLFVIPGIIFSTNYYFLPQSFILRDQRGKAALSYSEFLVKGNWWKVFLFGINQILISFGLYFIKSHISEALTFNFINYFIKLIVGNMISYLISSLFYVVNTLLFLNLDYRKNPSH
ncbi:MAG: hypothetical protein KME38_07070 [Spirirestis rafaelensis WJT71-NPBG6]|jgi:hypothetical protein|nr:hypothetical protein [Spirirestis rafaelensis WJT71-NPBG6]